MLLCNEGVLCWFQAVGEFLLQCARMENSAWLIAEAVDAIMDVFAEDHLNTVIRELELVQKLSALLPQLKAKVRMLTVYVVVSCCLWSGMETVGGGIKLVLVLHHLEILKGCQQNEIIIL